MMNSPDTDISPRPEPPAFFRETDALRDLRVMEAVEADSGVSQRELARELGVAVGVVNACLRALARKGMIKVRGESNRSVTYHLTKAGLLHKSALVLQWTANTVGFYRQARSQVAEHLTRLASEGHHRAVVFGGAELGEIAVLVAPQAGLEVVAAIVDGVAPLGDVVAGVRVFHLVDVPQTITENVDLVVLSEEATSEQLQALSAAFPAAKRFSLLGGTIDPDLPHGDIQA